MVVLYIKALLLHKSIHPSFSLLERQKPKQSLDTPAIENGEKQQKAPQPPWSPTGPLVLASDHNGLLTAPIQSIYSSLLDPIHMEKNGENMKKWWICIFNHVSE